VTVVAVFRRLRHHRRKQGVAPRRSYNCLTIRMIADERAAYSRAEPEIVAE
jgi:hypothetical protein